MSRLFRSVGLVGGARLMVAAFVLAAFFGVIGCGDSGGGGGGSGGGNGNSGLVGDWTPAWGNVYDNSRGFLSLKSSGEYCGMNFQKVADFWIDDSECYGTWRVSGNYIYFSNEYYGQVYESRSEYNISGNTLTITSCDYDDWENSLDCVTEEYTKGGNRPSGTIRSGDAALKGTSWHGVTGRRAFSFVGASFKFSSGSPSPVTSSFYLSDNCDRDVWYTNGSRLFMLGLTETNCYRVWNDLWGEYDNDCAYSIAETIEFNYTHVPGVSLTLTNTSLGIHDVWVSGRPSTDVVGPTVPTAGVAAELVSSVGEAWIDNFAVGNRDGFILGQDGSFTWVTDVTTTSAMTPIWTTPERGSGKLSARYGELVVLTNGTVLYPGLTDGVSMNYTLSPDGNTLTIIRTDLNIVDVFTRMQNVVPSGTTPPHLRKIGVSKVTSVLSRQGKAI